MEKFPINYSQCWEDTKVVLSALQVTPTDKVISITSGGDNTLAIYGQNPEILDALDYNSSQNYLLELKLAAFKNLSFEELFEFLGVRESTSRLTYFKKIESHLSSESHKFWTSNKKEIIKGIIHSGKFERYLTLFRRFILPLMHSRKEVSDLLIDKPIKDQIRYYDLIWNNIRWRWLFKVFFSSYLMKKKGRGDGMFAFNSNQKISDHYFELTQKALTSPTLFNNYYFQYILSSKYGEILPDYCLQENYRKIKESNTQIRLFTNNLLSFLSLKPDSCYSKFNLSDVFESMSENETAEAFFEILRVSQPNSLILFWNNLVYRDVPEILTPHFIRQIDLENELKITDRVFFYECFRIYKIQK